MSRFPAISRKPDILTLQEWIYAEYQCAYAEAQQKAADFIWHSMRKWGGDPRQQDTHPINCGCTYCN
jgi:hypothetical protein